MRRELFPVLFGQTVPVLNLNFAGGQYALGSQRASNFLSIPGATFTRASPALAQDLAGNVISFGSGVPAITNQGISIWQAATNILLWSNDLTQTAWVKVNTTAAMDQVGPDGVANSASSLTATANSGTALQTVTLASSARLVSVFLRRITGTGPVSLSGDGITWTAQTLTSAWSRFQLASATVLNPVTGIQFGTSGDKIGVAYFDNETGTFVTPPIFTTSAAATRAADLASVGRIAGPLATFTLVSSVVQNAAVSAFVARSVTVADDSALFMSEALVSSGLAQVNGSGLTSTNFGSFTEGAITKLGISANGGIVRANVNQTGAVAVTGTSTMGRISNLYVGNQAGGARELNGYNRAIVLFNGASSDGQLQKQMNTVP